MNSQISSIRNKGRRVRGYRIHIWRGAQYHPPSLTTPLMWHESPPLYEWQRVIADPTTTKAWMIQTGRKMKQFFFQREG